MRRLIDVIDMSIRRLDISPEKAGKYIGVLREALGDDVEGLIVYRNREGKLEIGKYEPCSRCLDAYNAPLEKLS